MPSVTATTIAAIKEAPPPPYITVSIGACVMDVDKKVIKSGSTLLSLLLKDQTGSIRLKCFDDNPAFETLLCQTVDSWIQLQASVKLYNGNPELFMQKSSTSSAVQPSTAPDGVTMHRTATVADLGGIDKDDSVSVDAMVLFCDTECDKFKEGRRKRQMLVQDQTGEVIVNLWDSTDDIQLGAGDCVRIKRARVGMHPIQQTRQLEVNWCKGAVEESSDQKLRTWWDEEGKQKPLQSLSGGFCKLVKVGDIKEIAEAKPAQKTSVDLACIVVEVDPHFGERLSMKVMDETGSVHVTAWDRKAQVLASSRPGDALLLRGAEVSMFRTASLVVNNGTQVGVRPSTKVTEDLKEWYAREGQRNAPVDISAPKELKRLVNFGAGERATCLALIFRKKTPQGEEFYVVDDSRDPIKAILNIPDNSYLTREVVLIRSAQMTDTEIKLFEDNLAPIPSGSDERVKLLEQLEHGK